MIDKLLHEMLYCQTFLACESHDCRAHFEFDEVANDPMDDWAQRAADEAAKQGWKTGHTGLVKCPGCVARA
ncbi:MAG: hypothetical protein V4857_26150 [Pseudomonadota bacterium]